MLGRYQLAAALHRHALIEEVTGGEGPAADAGIGLIDFARIAVLLQPVGATQPRQPGAYDDDPPGVAALPAHGGQGRAHGAEQSGPGNAGANGLDKVAAVAVQLALAGRLLFLLGAHVQQLIGGDAGQFRLPMRPLQAVEQTGQRGIGTT